jgi:Resolvase, N terminal domain/Recombinase
MARRAIAYLNRSWEADACQERSAVLSGMLQPDEGSVEAPRAEADGPLEIVSTMRETAGSEREREVLAQALRQIATGGCSVLLVERLCGLARSTRELVAVADWLLGSGADLVVLDVRLDTATGAGKQTLKLLRELERCERAPRSGAAPRGRPGIAASAPELGERIAALRASGSSLQAIADALTAEGVPTPRGGARWRPSSVQGVLGYRRPRPPVAGVPPPPPPAPGSSAPPPPRGAPPPSPRAPAPPPSPGAPQPSPQPPSPQQVPPSDTAAGPKRLRAQGPGAAGRVRRSLP